LGFYLAAPGAAVGLGRYGRFSYLTGTNGGSAIAFVFILACLYTLPYPRNNDEVELKTLAKMFFDLRAHRGRSEFRFRPRFGFGDCPEST